MIETLQVPRYLQNMFDVNFSKYTSEWQIDGKNVDRSNVAANMTYGSARKNAYSIIEDTLNLRDARVYDRVEQPDGTIKSVLNKKETMIAQEKQEAIKQAFKDWIFKDPDRREKLVNKYNVKLSITLDTLTARIMKLSSDSQRRIEPTPFYSRWDTTDRRADSAVAPVTHEISPDHRF